MLAITRSARVMLDVNRCTNLCHPSGAAAVAPGVLHVVMASSDCCNLRHRLQMHQVCLLPTSSFFLPTVFTAIEAFAGYSYCAVPVAAAGKAPAGTSSSFRGGNSAYNPQSLLSAVCCHAPVFRGRQQHDSHELMRMLLDGLQVGTSRGNGPQGAGRGYQQGIMCSLGCCAGCKLE
jgi:hypothetical protein